MGGGLSVTHPHRRNQEASVGDISVMKNIITNSVQKVMRQTGVA